MSPDTAQPQAPTKERTTGPLQRIGGWAKSALSSARQGSRGAAVPSTPEGTFYDRLMAEVESFTEDRATLDEKIHVKAGRIFATALPFLSVYAIGDIVGAFMVPAFGATPAHILAYSAEGIKSFLALSLASALTRKGEGPGYIARLVGTFLVWLILQIGTVYVLYITALQVFHGDTTGTLVRVASFGVLDLASVCCLYWKGKSLAQHVGQVNTKIAAFSQVHAAQQKEQQVKQQASIADQQNQMYLEAAKKFSDTIIDGLDDYLEQFKPGNNGNRNRPGRY